MGVNGLKYVKMCTLMFQASSTDYPPPDIMDQDMTLINGHICVKQYSVVCSV